MTATTRRTSARLAGNNAASSSSPNSSPQKSSQQAHETQQQNGGATASAAKKRKATTEQSSSSPKKERKTQAKLDDYSIETVPHDDDTLKDKENKGEGEEEEEEEEEVEDEGIRDEEMQDAANKVESEHSVSVKEKEEGGVGQADAKAEPKGDAKENGHASKREEEEDKSDKKTSKADQDHQAKDKNDPKATSTSNGQGETGAITESEERKEAMPSNILEKGIIYFFVRGRVGIDEPQGVKDVARSYIVLRPLPQGTKLGDGPIQDLENNRLCALPKKVLPKGPKDVFMTFVEKSHVTIEQLKRDFMEGSTYTTQTTGVRHSPNVTPVGEGVYAITSTGRSSHLAYMLTIPTELGQVQHELGLTDKGSFVVSAKNPESSSSANASLPEPANFPQKLMQDFRGRAWAPLQPQHLDYPNCQFLLIGDGHGTFGKAVEPMEKDEKNDDKETPQEEMEKLQGEDEERVQGLNEDDAVFEDLGISKKEFPKVQTTW